LEGVISTTQKGEAEMTVHDGFWFVLVGWVAGWVTGRSLKHTGYGAIGDALLGVLGGVAGGWVVMFVVTPFQRGRFPLSIAACAVGAVMVTWVVRAVIQRQGERNAARV
jgi:uncharacterized membrane protein YeaQ/YmgE (transglycosylase-associated protein family)